MAILERQVQVAFLENLPVLERVVGFSPSVIAAYLDLSIWGFPGQIDFVLADPTAKRYIVELEMVVSSKSKMEHVVEQVIRYNEAVRIIYSSDYTILVILASESPFTEEGSRLYRLISDLINIRREESKITGF